MGKGKESRENFGLGHTDKSPQYLLLFPLWRMWVVLVLVRENGKPLILCIGCFWLFACSAHWECLFGGCFFVSPHFFPALGQARLLTKPNLKGTKFHCGKETVCYL